MANSRVERDFLDFDRDWNEWYRSRRIKIGFDVHGVLDTNFDQYYDFISKLDDRFEIHIVTGIKEHLGLLEFPKLKQLNYDKWFSIHQQCEDDGVHIDYDHKNRPLVDPNIWDKMKAEYCKREGLLFLIDDSPVYGQHFKNSRCLYLHQYNFNRDNWRQI